MKDHKSIESGNITASLEDDELPFEREEKVTAEKLKFESGRIAMATIGALVYAIGINGFVVPLGLYTGGMLGYCQLLRTLLVSYLHLIPGSFDISGIIYYALNIPLFFMAKKRMGKLYLVKTVICVSEVSLFLTLIPIPAHTLINDSLAECLIAGILCGGGIGLILRMGACDGGMDIVGILLIRRHKDFSVGKLSLIMNFILYGIMLFLFNVQTVVYCLIYASVSAMAVDQVHSQNINVEVHIITKHSCRAMEEEVFSELGRGLTKWQAVGAYTEEGEEMLYVIVNKYEVNHLKRIVHSYDPKAFIVASTGVNVDGHFLKHLS
jgi:uncharacterized membrane-anchored protein YitT (DUF2179 family)